MNRCNILYIAYDGVLEPVAQSQVLGYIKELSGSEFNFYLLSYEKKSQTSDQAHLTQTENELKKHGIIWKRLTYHERPKILSTLFDIAVGIVYVSVIIRKNKIGIIHARAEVPALVAYVASRIFRTKFIYDRRGMMAYDYTESGIWPRDNLMTKAMFKIVDSLDKIFLKSADYVVVLTRKMEEMLRGGLVTFSRPPRIKVIPCCVDIRKFRIDEKNTKKPSDLNVSDKFILLYAGSLGTWNMLSEMLDFFAELKKLNPALYFLIITMSENTVVKNMIKEKNIAQGDFAVIGKKHKDIPRYLACANAAIMFRRPGLSKAAASPTKFSEYLACGLPVVINAGVGDTENLIKQNEIGVIIDEFSNEDYAKGARQLLSLIEKDSGVRQRCRKAAESNFSLAYGVEQYREIYEALR